VPRQTGQDHINALQEGYRSELIGIALAQALAASPLGADVEQQRSLALMERVEMRTRDLIASLLRAAGTEPEPGSIQARIPKIVAAVNGQPWREAHEWLLRGSELGRGVYQRIHDTAEHPNDSRIAAILKHVDAVNALYRGEIMGSPDRAPAMAYLEACNQLD
jgi:hypothetical protein